MGLINNAIDWNEPFGKFCRGTARIEFYAYCGGSGQQVNSLYVHDGSKTLAEIRDTYLDSRVRIQADNVVVFEGTLADLAVLKFQEQVRAMKWGIDSFWKHEFESSDLERQRLEGALLSAQNALQELQAKTNPEGVSDRTDQE